MPQRKAFAPFVLVAALATGAALADDQHHPAGAPPAAAGMPMMGMGGMMGQDGMGMQMMTRHVEGRIAFLKAEIKITDAQLPLWNAFAQAMRDNAGAMRGMMPAGTGMTMNQPGTLPDKLAAREKTFNARLEAIRKLKSAADPLYAALSADQKKTADDIMISPMGMMM